MAVRTFRDLVVWKKAMEFVTVLYKVTNGFPRSEVYGLTSQIRRCAVSIPANIAEGFGRNSPNEFIRFLEIAAGSLYELQTHIEIAYNLCYLEKDCFDGLYDTSREIERMLSSFIRSIQNEP